MTGNGKELTQSYRETQVAQVLLMLFDNPSLTQEEACKRVGNISVSTYRRWLHQGSDMIKALRALITASQRETLAEISMAKGKAVSMLITDILKETTDVGDRIKALRYLDQEADRLQRAHHARPGQEEKAHSFLKKGPETRIQISSHGDVEVRTEQDQGLSIHIQHEETDIVDGEFTEPEEPEEDDI